MWGAYVTVNNLYFPSIFKRGKAGGCILEPYACRIGVVMDEKVLSDILTEFLKLMLTCAFIPGFMLCTMLHLLGYGIFKGLTLLNIRN